MWPTEQSEFETPVSEQQLIVLLQKQQWMSVIAKIMLLAIDIA